MVVATMTGTLGTLNKPVSKIVFGTLFLHVTEDPYSVLDAAWGMGITTFDCAAIYGQGKCESILGCWLNDRGHQEEAVIITKGGCAGQSDLWAPRLDEASILQDLKDSKGRLQLPVIDVYMLHRDDKEISAGSIVDVMTKIVREGGVSSWAVSNWSTERIQAAINYAHEAGAIPPSCSSIQVALARPQHEVWPGTTYMRGEDIAWYKESAVPVLAWECLAKGFLAGKWDNVISQSGDSKPPPPVKNLTEANAPEWRQWKLHSAYLTKDNIAKYRRSQKLAEEMGMSSAVISFAWVLNQSYNAFALVGTTRVEHLKELAEAATLRLTPQQCLWLETGEWGGDEELAG
eukprot:TRINITY_DN10909_c0_g1_i1.p1 TRINITY_DN10909_c0_g1~~TRINITY_DN10909_c0_g1_i1.p1  ORF type:complete len:346 (+),score=79.47 TRINITY_DN10909_c0_g1_i1:38-1075(+)